MEFFSKKPAKGFLAMTKLRSSRYQQRMALKTAFRRSMLAVGGGACFEQATRVGAPTLYKYASAHDGEHYPPVDVLLDLDLEIGEPRMLTALAAVMGYDVIPLRSAEHRPTVADIGRLAKSSCDVQVSLSRALDDGVICTAEAAELEPVVESALEAFRSLKSQLGVISKGVTDA